MKIKNCKRCGVEFTGYRKSYCEDCKALNKKDYDRRRYHSNKEASRNRLKEYYKKNRDSRLQYAKEYREKNYEKVKAATAKYSSENRDKINKTRKIYRNKNLEKFKKWNKEYYLKNRDSILEKSKMWKKSNPEKVNASCAKRRAMKRNQLHPEHNVLLEERLQHKARVMEKLFNEKFTVDHILPLAHGGFHHHKNLQILPQKLNLEKSDSLEWRHNDYIHWTELPTELIPEALHIEFFQNNLT